MQNLGEKKGNKTATGLPMKISPCFVRGKPRFKLEIGVDGRRKRQFFKTEKEAVQARKDALEDRADLGKAWGLLSAREKAELIQFKRDMDSVGITLETLRQRAKDIQAAPQERITLAKAIEITLAAKREENCRGRYIDGLEGYLRMFARGREQMGVHEITEVHIKKWFNDRNEKPETRNSNRGRLSAFASQAARPLLSGLMLSPRAT